MEFCLSLQESKLSSKNNLNSLSSTSNIVLRVYPPSLQDKKCERISDVDLMLVLEGILLKIPVSF